MSWYLWFVYSMVVLVATLLPGPAVLLSLTHGVRYGVGRAVFTVSGIIAAAVVYAMIALAGLGAALAASATLFGLVKWCGAAYLIWIGFGMLRSKGAKAEGVDAATVILTGRWRLFQKGLLVGLSNPKAIVFFTSLFPQFIPVNAVGHDYFLPMILGVIIWGYVGTMVYVFGGHSLSRLLNKPLVSRYFQKGVGAAFICSGLGLAVNANR